jgi:hypothetical protein
VQGIIKVTWILSLLKLTGSKLICLEPVDHLGSPRLEEELRAHPSDTSRRGCRYLTELSAGEVALNRRELGMVEDVEELAAQLEGVALVDLRRLRYSSVCIDDARAKDGTGIGVADDTFLLGAEGGWVEEGVVAA